MRNNTVAALSAVFSACLVGAAWADEPSRFNLQATANETYDSNVAQSGAAAAAQRGITPADTIFAPFLAAGLTLPLGRQSLFLKGSVGYSLYSKNTVLNSGAVNVEGGFAARVRDCKATLTGSYSNQRTSLQDLVVTVTRNIADTELVRLDGECGGPIGLGPTLSVVQQWSNNSAPSLFASDFRSVTATAGIAYRRPSFGELSLVGSYGQTDFPNRGLLVGPATTQDGFRDYSIGVRYERKLGARIEGTVRIAYTTLVPYAAGVAGYGGIEYSGDVSLRVSSRLQAHFSLGQAPIPTIVSNSTYSLERHYSAEADYTIGPKLSLRLSGSETTDRYNGAAVVSGVDIQRESAGTVSGAVRFKLSRRFAIELDGAHQVRSADVAIYNYTDDRVGLAFSAAI
jgi:hypothetical protein